MLNIHPSPFSPEAILKDSRGRSKAPKGVVGKERVVGKDSSKGKGVGKVGSFKVLPVLPVNAKSAKDEN